MENIIFGEVPEFEEGVLAVLQEGAPGSNLYV